MAAANWWSRAAANSKPLPEPEPGAVREPVVVSSIRGRKVARSQRAGVRYGQDMLQQFDLGNGLFNVHPSQYVPEGEQRQTGRRPFLSNQVEERS